MTSAANANSGKERQHVRDHQQLAGLLGRRDHRDRRRSASSAIAFSTSTCLPACSAVIAVSGCRCGRIADVDQIDVGVGEHVVELLDTS